MDGGKAMTHMIEPKILQFLQVLFHFVFGYVLVVVYIEIIGINNIGDLLFMF